MRRVLLIFLSLVLALVGWSTVCAEDSFYVIPAMRGNYAPVPKTGDTWSQGPRDDGALQQGVARPISRFTDNKNGTVTDNLTGLIWMKDASVFGTKPWADALSDAATVANNTHGLTDGSQAGDWRLPNLRELQSLVDYGTVPFFNSPSLPAGHPFTGVQSSAYWSSTNYAKNTTWTWTVSFYGGGVGFEDNLTSQRVWCVRGGP